MSNTTLILAGGHDRNFPDFGVRLATFINREVDSPVILSCGFSQDSDSWAEKAPAWHDWYTRYFPAATVIDAVPEKFYEQALAADVVYLHGGETKRLLDTLPDYEKVKSVLSGKIVIGSSAGANYLSSVHYSPSAAVVREGSAILNMGVIVHYGAPEFDGRAISMTEWQNHAARVKELSGGNVLLIPEGDFAIIRI